jgi:hypothetical protein
MACLEFEADRHVSASRSAAAVVPRGAVRSIKSTMPSHSGGEWRHETVIKDGGCCRRVADA